jgi:hypothetical protein
MSAAGYVEVRVRIHDANDRYADVTVAEDLIVGRFISTRVAMTAAEAAASANQLLNLDDRKPLVLDRRKR